MPIDFSELSDDEAARFLENWAAGFDDRLARLGDIAGAADPLDLSRASLVRLWEWYLAGRPFPEGTAARPAWQGAHDTAYVAAEDLGVIDAMATYLTATLRANFSELELAVGHVPGMRRYVHRRKPVLRSPEGWEVDPIDMVFARAATADPGSNPDALAFFYDRTEERRSLR